MPSKKKKYNARFPPARIKKIMQTDEDVGKVAAAVPVIISRALELFIESLILKTNETTKARNAKTLSTAHIKQTILAEKKFDFLKDLVANVPDVQPNEEEADGPSTPSDVVPPKTRGRPRKRKVEDRDEPRERKRRQRVQSNVDDSETEDADTDTANEHEFNEDVDNETDSETESRRSPHDDNKIAELSGGAEPPLSRSLNSCYSPTSVQPPFPYPHPSAHLPGRIPSVGLPHPMLVPQACPPNSTCVMPPYTRPMLGPTAGGNNIPAMTLPGYASGLPTPPGSVYATSFPSGTHTQSSATAYSPSAAASLGKATQNKPDDDDDYDS